MCKNARNSQLDLNCYNFLAYLKMDSTLSICYKHGF